MSNNITNIAKKNLFASPFSPNSDNKIDFPKRQLAFAAGDSELIAKMMMMMMMMAVDSWVELMTCLICF